MVQGTKQTLLDKVLSEIAGIYHERAASDSKDYLALVLFGTVGALFSSPTGSFFAPKLSRGCWPVARVALCCGWLVLLWQHRFQ